MILLPSRGLGGRSQNHGYRIIWVPDTNRRPRQIANDSTCTSQSYTASHVLRDMGLLEDHVKEALRLSWCHLTPDPP